MKSKNSAVSSAQLNSTQLKKDIIASIFFLSIFISLSVLAAKLINFICILSIFWTVWSFLPFVVLIILTLTLGFLTIPLVVSLYRFFFEDRTSLFDNDITKGLVICSYLFIITVSMFTTEYNYSGINYNRSISQQPFIWKSFFTSIPEVGKYYIYIEMQNDNIWTDITALSNITNSFKSIEQVKSNFIKKFKEIIQAGETVPSKLDITDDNAKIWHVNVRNITIEETYMKLK